MNRLSRLAVPALVLVGLSHTIIGFLGLEFLLDGWPAFAITLASVVFRFFAPLSIGAFFGAVDVLGWPAWVAAMHAALGIFLITRWPPFGAMVRRILRTSRVSG